MQLATLNTVHTSLQAYTMMSYIDRVKRVRQLGDALEEYAPNLDEGLGSKSVDLSVVVTQFFSKPMGNRTILHPT
jgi:hypothetical protein